MRNQGQGAAPEVGSAGEPCGLVAKGGRFTGGGRSSETETAMEVIGDLDRRSSLAKEGEGSARTKRCPPPPPLGLPQERVTDGPSARNPCEGPQLTSHSSTSAGSAEHRVGPTCAWCPGCIPTRYPSHMWLPPEGALAQQWIQRTRKGLGEGGRRAGAAEPLPGAPFTPVGVCVL